LIWSTRRKRFSLSGTARFPRVSYGFSLVVVEQAGEVRVSLDLPDAGAGDRSWRLTHLIQRHVAKRLMRSDRIAIPDVCLHDEVEMLEAETEEVIQTLTFERADPVLRVAVGDRRLD